MSKYDNTIADFENNHIKRKTVRLKDMPERFADSSGANQETLIYEVFVKLFDPINMALTVIEPGNVNGEYHMTNGHIHEKDNPELYFLLEGEGLLLIERGEESNTLPLSLGGVTLMPSGYAHRAINTGTQKLKFVTVHYSGSGRTYGYDFVKIVGENMSKTFREGLRDLINCHSKENGSDTPDFILAEYIDDCLAAFDKATTIRTKWYDPEKENQAAFLGPCRAD